MKFLAIDVGSSSVKCAVLRDSSIYGQVARCAFETRHENDRAEIEADAVLGAIGRAIGQTSGARHADAIALGVMSPSWVAMDRRGRAITPIITHQDRRAIEIAQELENRVGKQRHLRIAGNRPFPGGISSTTWLWHRRHAPEMLKKIDLVGHLNTLLHRQITGERVIDPSNASFTGLYETVRLGGWSDELCAAAEVPAGVLPRIRGADEIAGTVKRDSAARFGLKQGTPVYVGLIDTSAAMLLAGARAGQIVNVSGSTDVLCLCTDSPRPHERLLLRALGVGRKWLSVSTLAAAGSAIIWAKDQLFADWTEQRFYQLIAKLARRPGPPNVRFDPYLAGDRTSMEQKRGAFSGLTLSTTREELLGAILQGLAQASAARLPLLLDNAACKVRRSVITSGGTHGALADLLHRDWPGRWTFHNEPDATLRGLSKIAE